MHSGFGVGGDGVGLVNVVAVGLYWEQWW